MDNPGEKITGAADHANAETKPKEEAAAAFGKFKDAGTLYRAYAELEAEFTRRSQRLKELESGNKVSLSSDGTKEKLSPPVQPFLNKDELLKSVLADAEVRDAVIGGYLKEMQSLKSVPLTAGGGGVAAPKSGPKTLKEAGKLAGEFLKNNL